MKELKITLGNDADSEKFLKEWGNTSNYSSITMTDNGIKYTKNDLLNILDSFVNENINRVDVNIEDIQEDIELKRAE